MAKKRQVNNAQLASIALIVRRAISRSRKDAGIPGESADYRRGVRDAENELLYRFRQALGADWERHWELLEESHQPEEA